MTGSIFGILGATQFDQHVINMALIHLCNQESHVGKEMKRIYSAWGEEMDETIYNPWLDLYQFTIYVPHPKQEYEGITLEAGLTHGYNIEVQRVGDRAHVPYKIPPGGQFVVVMKQRGIDQGYAIAATGIFVRPMAALSLDIVVDLERAEYQSIVVKHPIIREHIPDLERKIVQFVKGELGCKELPNIVGYVDQRKNTDYCPPSWEQLALTAKPGFAG